MSNKHISKERRGYLTIPLELTYLKTTWKKSIFLNSRVYIREYKGKCACGKDIYPHYNIGDESWFNCQVVIFEEEVYFACSKSCIGNSHGESRRIFNKCKKCGKDFPVQGVYGVGSKRSALSTFCSECAPSKSSKKASKISNKNLKEIENFIEQEKIAQKKFEKSFYQAGAPGTGGNRDRFKKK